MSKTILNCYIEAADAVILRGIDQMKLCAERKENGWFQVLLYSDSCFEYDTGNLLSDFQLWIDTLDLKATFEKNTNVSLLLEFTITASHVKEEPVPWLDFDRSFIRKASLFNLSIDVIVNIESSFDDCSIYSGVYLHLNPLSNSSALDVPSIQHAAGMMSLATMKSNYSLYSSDNAWCLACKSDGLSPETPICELMNLIKTPSELCNYSELNGLESHIDITCYGIPNNTTVFRLNREFFSFCDMLNIEYCTLDLR